MEFLENIAGMFTSGLVRILVVVVTLGGVYLLIVKPVLKTTSDVAHTQARAQAQQQRAEARQQAALQRGIQRQVRQATRGVGQQVRSITRSTTHVFHTSDLRQQRKLLNCIQRAAPDTSRIEACSRRYSG